MYIFVKCNRHCMRGDLCKLSESFESLTENFRGKLDYSGDKVFHKFLDNFKLS